MAVVAWPPPVPPNTRANVTPIVDAHPADHNKIADALDTIIAQTATAWIALPFAAGFANYGAPYQNCQYRKRGDVVELRGTWRMNTPAAPANQLVATLPAGYRPPANVQIAGAQAGTQVNCYVEIAPDGTMKLVGGTGNVLGMTMWGWACSVTP